MSKTKNEEPRIMNLKQMCRLLDISPTTARMWIGRGMPVMTQPGPGVTGYTLDISKVFTWRIKYEKERHAPKGKGKQTIDEAKLRKELASAKKMELDLAEKLGFVVRQDKILRSLENVCLSVKTNLMSIPAKAAPTIMHLDNPTEIQSKLTGFLTVALSELTVESIIDGAGTGEPVRGAED